MLLWSGNINSDGKEKKLTNVLAFMVAFDFWY
jgi:hypothetical protein